jgi:hypothetical protein
MSPKSPTLYRLAADRQYESIPPRVQSNPEDLLWTDRYGSTALHILCQARNVSNDLLKAVDAILERAPEQVAWANIATWTPLHFAVEKRLVVSMRGDNDNDDNHHIDINNTTLILRLIQACPNAVSLRTHSGFKTKTPFHIACEVGADYCVLKAMLSINPALATEPFVKRDFYSIREDPLQLLWKSHRQIGGAGDVERKMALLLQAAHCRTVRGRFGKLLNAACSVRTPRDYFTKLLTRHLRQVSQPDDDGLYPLHYAVRNATSESQAYTQYVLENILAVYPEAATIPDRQGRLPLHVAIAESILTWHKGGLRELALSNTSALREPDPVCGLLPFLASAEAALHSRLHLSTTYELLRLAPDVTQTCRIGMTTEEEEENW